MAQGAGCRPAKQKVTSSIPGWGTCLGVGSVLGPGAFKRQPIDVCLSHRCLPPSFSLLSSLSRNKEINLSKLL